MAFVEYFLLRLLLWIGLLSALLALAVGPRKLRSSIKRMWSIMFRKRLDPEEILTNVVLQHQQHVKAVREAVSKAEAAEVALRANLKQSEEHVPVLEAEAKRLASDGDELGARAALYKKQLEQSAIENFREQLERHCGMIAESRHRLFMLELQLRQYEVGRSILLSQLAQAEKTEEQYASARRFDPFNAVANWQQAEGLVLEKSLNARAKERVYVDTTDMAGFAENVEIPETFVDYSDHPREYSLSAIQTVVRVHTRVSDLYNGPYDQLEEQVRLTVEGIKERQEWELVNNNKFGLIHSADPAMRISTRYGAPTPDDLDELLALVWKKPAFFLAHPKAIAAFERECTWRGVPPVTMNLFGFPVVTWRGIPLVPCDKLEMKSRYQSTKWFGTTSILLMRVGESDQGVVGLHQAGIPGELSPSLSARLMGLDSLGVASYLLTLYFSAAVLTDDALGVLENVEVNYYHDYNSRMGGFESGGSGI